MSDSRDEKIREGCRLRDLGYYRKALVNFKEAQGEFEDLDLLLEISLLLASMGLNVRALENITSALDNFSNSEQDRQIVAHARLFHSFYTMWQTARPSQPLKIATEIYNEHLATTPVECYTQRLIAMESLYSLFFEILGVLGHPVHAVPKTSIGRFEDLFRHCMARNWFERAELLARLYSDYHLSEREHHESGSVGAGRSGLYLELLKAPFVPGNVRTKALRKLSQLLEDNGEAERAQETINEVISIYGHQDHACGAVLVELEQLSLPSSSFSSSQRLSRLEEIKTRLEDLGHWSDATAASRHMFTITVIERLDNKMGEKLYEQTLAMPGSLPGSVTWIKWQLQRLLAATSFPDRVEEKVELEKALRQLADQTLDIVPLSQRHISAGRMCDIADIYLNQVQLLGIDSTKELVHCCFQHVEPVLPRLTVNGRHRCTGQMLQIKARLLLIGIMFAPPVFETRLALLRQATVAHEEALRYYQTVDLPLLAGFAASQLAVCHRMLWESTGKTPDSPSFHEAARYFDEASVLLQKYGSMEAYQRSAQYRLNLWFDNYKVTRGTSTETWEAPLQKTTQYLEELEQTVNRQRHDLSGLATEQALTAKQALRNNEAVRTLFNVAIHLHAFQEDIDRVWQTIQKSKARSVSDLLGLGVVLPKDLATQIEGDAEACLLLEKERQLLGAVEEDSTDTQLQLQMRLDTHRESMKQNVALKELLELREGVPVTISRLQALSNVLESQGSTRHVVFVDYFTLAGELTLLVLCADDVNFYNSGITVTQIDAWKVKHLQLKEPLNHDDEDDNLAALQELTALVEPLAKICDERDLLVLCASGPLHAVPLHAVPLNGDSSACLIDRNPVVYCPSMTVFEQCVMRAYDEGRQGVTHGQALIAAYETPDEDIDWEYQRTQAYETVLELADQFDDARTLTGVEANAEQFKVECEKATIVHFLGHCDGGAKNSMQHLVLVANEQSSSGEPHGESKVTALSTAPFTISDLFSTSIHASHFNLVACGSASQVIGQGDEPWGIVTALLCAGATSVGGTMWPIHVGTGEMFMKELYKKDAKSSGEGGIVDLAVAHQMAVKGLKKGMDTREPYHWAAFVLHGSWFYRG